MAKVSQLGIRPGDDVDWTISGNSLQVTPSKDRQLLDLETRLRLFDQATDRQRRRQRDVPLTPASDGDRGWSREELYDRG